VSSGRQTGVRHPPRDRIVGFPLWKQLVVKLTRLPGTSVHHQVDGELVVEAPTERPVTRGRGLEVETYRCVLLTSRLRKVARERIRVICPLNPRNARARIPRSRSMSRRYRIVGVAATQVLLVSATLAAQSISFGLRGTGSFPTGSFAQQASGPSSDVLIEGAKSGFGYGLDLGLGLGPIGIYAGFDHIKFDCQTETCQSDGKYTLQGVTAGVKLAMPMLNRFRPYVKGGVTFQDLQGGYGASSSNVLVTDKTPGYEIGLGLDYSLLSVLSLTPQARYVGQKFKARIPGVETPTESTAQGANYFTFDLGLSVHTPFSGGGKHER
jgi:opacity protein-like surface antigen